MDFDTSSWTARIRRLLPRGWFAEEGSTPLLDGLLAGLGYAHAQLSAWYAFSRAQTRLATATDVFLDGLAADFLGSRISRNVGEADTAFRVRVRREILRPRATRSALVSELTALTGVAPLVVEPGNSSDTGGYRLGGVGYGTGGAYGSVILPFQVFVTAFRPAIAPPPGVDGYRGGLGGYGVGAVEYAQASAIVGVPDEEVYAAIESTRPAATIIWTRLTNGAPTATAGADTLDDDFVLDESELDGATTT